MLKQRHKVNKQIDSRDEKDGGFEHFDFCPPLTSVRVITYQAVGSW